MVTLVGAAVAAVVPWRYREGGGKSLWAWQTALFTAVILRQGDAWLWEVSVQDTTVLGAGAGTDFEGCEFRCLETIGKAFHAQFPFARLTQNAAAHYELADGRMYDLSPYDGVHMLVTLDDGRVVSGILGIRDWWLHVTMGERIVDVHPAHVLRLQPAFGW